MDKLKRCPFCGGEAKLCGQGPNRWVECQRCFVQTRVRRKAEEATKDWNSRTEEEAQK